MNIRNVKQLGARITNGVRTKGQLSVDAALVRELAALLSETGLTEIEIEHGGQRIRVAKHEGASVPTHTFAPVMSEPVETAKSESTKREAPSGTPVPSPMVGTVYVAPEPGKPPFVSVGDTVKEGDTLMIVEAMKTMNPIVATKAGKVSEICVTDAQPVEFGQTLLILS